MAAGMLVLALGVLSAPQPVPAAAACPSAKTCSRYKTMQLRWAQSRSGKVVIPFWINAAQPWLPADRVEQAVIGATAAWARANPRIVFRYLGRTDRPVRSNDGFNVIGWHPLRADEAAYFEILSHEGSKTIKEADVYLNLSFPWSWAPCRQANRSCTTAKYDGPLQYWDLQHIITHELGHWLGLDHLTSEQDAELTMYHLGNDPGERWKATLALGDVRGVRRAYPCPRCAAPGIYRP